MRRKGGHQREYGSRQFQSSSENGMNACEYWLLPALERWTVKGLRERRKSCALSLWKQGSMQLAKSSSSSSSLLLSYSIFIGDNSCLYHLIKHGEEPVLKMTIPLAHVEDDLLPLTARFVNGFLCDVQEVMHVSFFA